MLEFIMEFIGEFLLQIVVELLIELGLHSMAEPFNRAPNPWLAALGYALFGIIAGAISLALFPASLVLFKAWRITNLILTPVAAGLLMSAMGVWRAKRGQAVLRIDRFAYGYLFALGFALIRFMFAA